MSIKALSKALFEQTPISFVSYFGHDLKEDVFWKDSTQPDIQNGRLELDYPLWGLFLEQGCYWANAFEWQQVNDYYKAHGLANVFFIIKRDGDLVENFVFATTDEHSGMINYYLNHTDKLEAFVHLFKTQGKDYIEKLKQTRLPIFDHFKFDPKKFGIDYQDMTKPFFQAESYDVRHDKVVNLSSRERQVLYYSALEGKTAKEIGGLIKLSPKTVESHLDKLKVKLSAKSTKVLLRRAIEIGIIRLQAYF